MNRKSRQWLVATAFGLSAVLNASPPASATTKYPTAMPISATNREVHDRAVNAVLRGRYNEALQGFDDVLKNEPSNASAYYNRGNVRYFRRELLLALQDYTAALKYRPGFAAATMNRGIVLSILDRLDEALTDLDTAAELDPSNPDVFFNRAVVYVKRGAMEKALADYDRLVQLDGSNPDLNAARLRLNALLTRIDELGLVRGDDAVDAGDLDALPDDRQPDRQVDEAQERPLRPADRAQQAVDRWRHEAGLLGLVGVHEAA